MATGEIIRTIDTERRNIPEKVKKTVYARDGLCCRYCGYTHKDSDRYHLDHVVPVSHGGSNSVGNLVVACAQCNHRKGNQLWWRPLPVREAKAIKHTVAKREQRRGGRWRYEPDRRCLPGYEKPSPDLVVDSPEQEDAPASGELPGPDRA